MSGKQLHSVIGDSDARLPVGGRIRTGIKVLKAAAKDTQRAVEIYMKGAEAGDSFSAIEEAITKECKIAHPLVPRNVPYFVVRRGDFFPPEQADRLMERYGEEVQGRQRLYKFPIILLWDDWLKNMPHSHAAYAANELRFWSEYIGPDRYCYTHADVEVDKKAKRGMRVYGGRSRVMNPAMPDGLCTPDQCDLYQEGKCKLKGRLIGLIPGIDSTSLIDIPTTSYYAMSQWRAQMLAVQQVRGHISGFHDGDPVFWLVKREQEVSRVVDGKALKTKQYLAQLEIGIPLEKLHSSRPPAIPVSSAVAVLEGPSEDYDDAPPAGDEEGPF
jgi:hypothetical protein